MISVESLETTQELILDFQNLEYISSAGVREVVAAYRKKTNGVFQVVNVIQDVYYIQQ